MYSYEGSEIQEAIASFASQFPDVALTVKTGTHDQLYDDLRFGKIDLVINDQRRAFSTDYENLVLTDLPFYVECAHFGKKITQAITSKQWQSFQPKLFNKTKTKKVFQISFSYPKCLFLKLISR